MVFALAGDSTMTRPLDKLNLGWFETSTKVEKLSAFSYQLSAPQGTNQGRQHSLDLDYSIRKALVISNRQEMKVTSQEQVIFEFACRSNCNVQKAAEFSIALSASASRNVGPDRS